MANSNFNYLKKDVVNWLPLSVLNRTNERWEDGVHYTSSEATANFGGGSTEEYGTKILYAFGLGAPAGSRPLYYTTENFGNLDSENDAIVLNNWGQYDMLGVKRAHSGVVDPNSELDTQPLENESGIFVNTKYAIKVWLFYGSTFNGGVTSTSESTEGVGYWAEYTNIPAGESATIPWIRDQYGFQSERMYFQYDLTVDTTSQLNVMTNTELGKIEEVSDKRALSTEDIAEGLTSSDIYGLTVVPAFGPILIDGTPGDASLDKDVLIIETGDDELDATFGPMSSDYIDSMDITSTFAEHSEGEVVNTIQVDGQVGTSYLLVGNPAKTKVPMTNTYDSEADKTTFSFSVPAHEEGDSLMLFFNVNVEGVLSGFVEGSAISGATVEGFAADGTKQSTTSDANGAYNFDVAVHGVIIATGGVNSLTNEAFEGELKTNTKLGAVLSNITTEINAIMEEDGATLDEALETMVDPNVKEMSGMDASITKEDLREYAKKGVAGLQREGKAVSKIAKIAAANKSIEEESKLALTAFDTENLTPRQKRNIKKSVRRAQRKAKRAMKRGRLEEYKARLEGKLEHAEITAIETGKIDMRQIRLAAMLEAVEDAQQEGFQVRGDLETRKQALKTTIETKESKVEIEVAEGDDFEAMILKLNEEAERRNSAQMKMVKDIEEQKEEIRFAVEEETFAIQKTATGYQTSGTVLREVTREEEQVEIVIEDDFMAASRVAELEVRTQVGRVIIAGEREIREEDIEVLPYRMKASNYIVFSENVEKFEEQYFIRTSWSIRQAAVNANGEKFEVHFEIRDLANDRNIHLDHDAWNEGSQFREVLDILLKLGELFEEVRDSRVYHEMNEIYQFINEDSSAIDIAIAEFKKQQAEINERIANLIEQEVEVEVEDQIATQKKEVEGGARLFVSPTLYELIEEKNLLTQLNEDFERFSGSLSSTRIFAIVDFAANMQTFANMRAEEDMSTLKAELEKAVQEGNEPAAAVLEYRINEMQNRIDAFQELSNTVNISPSEIEFPEMNNVEQVDEYLQLLENAHASVTEDRDSIQAISEKHGFDVSSFDKALAETLAQIEERTDEANKLKAELSGDAEVFEWEAREAENFKNAATKLDDVLNKSATDKAAEEKEVAAFNRIFVRNSVIEKLHSEFGGEQLVKFVGLFGIDEYFGGRDIASWSYFKSSIFNRGEQLDAYIAKTKADEEMHEKVKELNLNKFESLKDFVNTVVGKYEGMLPEIQNNIDFKAANAEQLASIFKLAKSTKAEFEDAQKTVSELREKFAEFVETNEIVDRAKDFVSEAKSFEDEIGSLILETEAAEYKKAQEAWDNLRKDAQVQSKTIAGEQMTFASLTDEAKDLKSEIDEVDASHKKEIKKLNTEQEEANAAGDEALVEKIQSKIDELEKEFEDTFDSLNEKLDKIEEERAARAEELDKALAEYEENIKSQEKAIVSTLIEEARDVEQYNQYVTAGNIEEYLDSALLFDRANLIEIAIQNLGTPDYEKEVTSERKSEFEEAIFAAIEKTLELGKSVAVFRYGGGYNGNAAAENGLSAYQQYFPSRYVNFQQQIEVAIPQNTDWGMSRYAHLLTSLISIYQKEGALKNHVAELEEFATRFKEDETSYLRAIYRAEERPSIGHISEVNGMDSYISSLKELIDNLTEELSGEEKEFALSNYGKALEKAESELQSFWQEFEVISMFDEDKLQDELNRIEESRREAEEKIRLEYETKEEFFAKLDDGMSALDDNYSAIEDWAPTAFEAEAKFEAQIKEWNDYWSYKLATYSKSLDKLSKEGDSLKKSIDDVTASKAEAEKTAKQQADEFEAKSSYMAKSFEEEIADLKAQLQKLDEETKGGDVEGLAKIEAEIASVTKQYEAETAMFEKFKADQESKSAAEIKAYDEDIARFEESQADLNKRGVETAVERKEAEEIASKFSGWVDGSEFLNEPFKLWSNYHDEAKSTFGPLTGEFFHRAKESFDELMRSDVRGLSDATQEIAAVKAKDEAEKAQYEKTRVEMKAEISNTDQSIQDSIDSETAQHEKAMSELKAKAAEAPEEEVAGVEAEMEATQEKHDTLIAKLKEELDAAHANYKKQIVEVENKEGARIASVAKQLEDLETTKTKLEEEVAQQENEKEDVLNNILDEYKNRSENYLQNRDQWSQTYLGYYTSTFETITDQPKELGSIMALIKDSVGNAYHIELEGEVYHAQSLQSQITDLEYMDNIGEKEAKKLEALNAEFSNMIEGISNDFNENKYRFSSHGVKRLFEIGGGYAGSQNKFGAGEIEASEYPFREWNKVISILFDDAQISIGREIVGARTEGGRYKYFIGSEAHIMGIDMVGGRDQAQSNYSRLVSELRDYADLLFYKDTYQCRETEQIEEMDRDLEDAVTIVSQLKENIADAVQQLADIENGGSGEYGSTELDKNKYEFYLAGIEKYKSTISDCYDDSISEPEYNRLEDNLQRMKEISRELEDQFMNAVDQSREQLNELKDQLSNAEQQLAEATDSEDFEGIKLYSAEVAKLTEALQAVKEQTKEEITQAYGELQDVRSNEASELKHRLKDVRESIKSYVKEEEASLEAQLTEATDATSKKNAELNKLNAIKAETEDSMKVSDEEYEASKAEAEKSYKEQLNEFEDKSSYMAEKHEEEVAELKKALEGADEEKAASIEAELASVIKQYEDEVAKFDQYKKDTKDEFNTEQADVEKKHQEDQDKSMSDIAGYEKQIAEAMDEMVQYKEIISSVSEQKDKLAKFLEQSNDSFMDTWSQLHERVVEFTNRARAEAGMYLEDEIQSIDKISKNITSLEAEISSLRKEKDDLEMRLDKNQVDFSQAEAEVEKAKADKDDAESNRNDVASDLKSFENRVAELEKETADSKNKLKAESEELEKATAEKEEATTEKAEREDKLKSLEANIAETNKSIMSTKENVKVESEELEKANAEKEKATAEKAEREEKLKSLEASSAELDKSIAEKKKSVEEKEADIKKAEAEEAQATESKADKDATIKDYQVSITETTEQKMNNVADYESFVAQKKEAIKDADTAGDEALKADHEASLAEATDAHEAYLETTNATLDDLKSSKEQLEVEAKELAVTIDDAKATISQATTDKTELESEIDKSTAENASVKKSIASEKSEITNLEVTITEKTTTVAQKSERISSLEEDLNKLEAVKAEREKSIANEKSQIEKLEAVIEEETTTVAEKSDKIMSLEEDLNKLETEIADSQKIIAKQKSDINDLEVTIDTAQTTIAEKEDLISSIAEGIKFLERNRTDVADKLKATEFSKAQNESDVEKLKSDFERTATDFEDVFRNLHDEFRQIREDLSQEFYSDNGQELESKSDDAKGALELIQLMDNASTAYVINSLTGVKKGENGYTDWEQFRNDLSDARSDAEQVWDKGDTQFHTVKQLLEVGGGYLGSLNGFKVGTSLEEWQSFSNWSYTLYRSLGAEIEEMVDDLYKEDAGNYTFEAYEILALKTDANPGSEDFRIVESTQNEIEENLKAYKVNVYYFDSYNNQGLEGLPKLDSEIENREETYELLVAQYEKLKNDEDNDPDGEGGGLPELPKEPTRPGDAVNINSHIAPDLIREAWDEYDRAYNGGGERRNTFSNAMQNAIGKSGPLAYPGEDGAIYITLNGEYLTTGEADQGRNVIVGLIDAEAEAAKAAAEAEAKAKAEAEAKAKAEAEAKLAQLEELLTEEPYIVEYRYNEIENPASQYQKNQPTRTIEFYWGDRLYYPNLTGQGPVDFEQSALVMKINGETIKAETKDIWAGTNQITAKYTFERNKNYTVEFYGALPHYVNIEYATGLPEGEHDNKYAGNVFNITQFGTHKHKLYSTPFADYGRYGHIETEPGVFEPMSSVPGWGIARMHVTANDVPDLSECKLMYKVMVGEFYKGYEDWDYSNVEYLKHLTSGYGNVQRYTGNGFTSVSMLTPGSKTRLNEHDWSKFNFTNVINIGEIIQMQANLDTQLFDQMFGEEGMSFPNLELTGGLFGYLTVAMTEEYPAFKTTPWFDDSVKHVNLYSYYTRGGEVNSAGGVTAFSNDEFVQRFIDMGWGCIGGSLPEGRNQDIKNGSNQTALTLNGGFLLSDSGTKTLDNGGFGGLGCPNNSEGEGEGEETRYQVAYKGADGNFVVAHEFTEQITDGRWIQVDLYAYETQEARHTIIINKELFPNNYWRDNLQWQRDQGMGGLDWFNFNDWEISDLNETYYQFTKTGSLTGTAAYRFRELGMG